MTSNRCQRCGLVNFAGTSECRRCKEPIAWGAEGAAGQPEFSSQPTFGGGGGDSYRPQSFQAVPALPNYGAPAGGYVRPYEQTAKLRSGLATASLILGILGMFSLGILIIGSLIGLVLGIRAVLKAKREPHVYGGKGIGIGGIATNSIALLSVIPVALIAAIAIPNLLMARQMANEASAIGSLRRMATAESDYMSTLGRGRTFASMEELVASGAIPRNSGVKSGYLFKIRLLDRNGDVAVPGVGDAVRFEAVATPLNYGSSGRRSFYVSEEWIIRCADKKGKEATRSDPDVDESFREEEPPFEQRLPVGGDTPRRRT